MRKYYLLLSLIILVSLLLTGILIYRAYATDIVFNLSI